jgi:ferrous iron transport protein A
VKDGGAAATVGLDELPPGARGTVRSVGGPAGLRQRLLEMGLTEGTSVEVIRRAPLGDPLEIRVRGYFLSIRRHDAHDVQVEREAR